MLQSQFDDTCCKGLVWVGAGLALMLVAALALAADSPAGYDAAKWNPIHFKPAIEKADDKQCLVCHAEVLKPSVRAQSPAGVKADASLAWYQTLDVYSGTQDTFHRRHLTGELAQKVMNLRCNTCHQGHEPRDEAPNTHATSQAAGYTLRKQVDPKTCLMCHGQFNYPVMGLAGAWPEQRETFGDNCLTCHAGIRTTRHNVNFLNAKGIEAEAEKSSDTCYGCHGGRAWYRINFPYPRHAWEGMDKEVPDWAKNRPTTSEPRFQLQAWAPATPSIAAASDAIQPARKSIEKAVNKKTTKKSVIKTTCKPARSAIQRERLASIAG